jgi:hypothetical protein
MPKRDKYKTAFYAHRQNARKRSIEFLFSFDEWLRVWQESGHLHERGCRRGQYCMARFGDAGPYASWNVKIILHSENIVEKIYKDSQREAIMKSNLSREYKKFSLTKKQREKISKKLKGKKHTKEHRKNHAVAVRIAFAHRRAAKR